jgi:hypothetical protein
VFPALPFAPLAIDDRARQWFKSSDGLAVREAVPEFRFAPALLLAIYPKLNNQFFCPFR